MNPANGDLECRCGDRYAVLRQMVKEGGLIEVRSEQRLIEEGDALPMWTAQGGGVHMGQLELVQRLTVGASVTLIYHQKYIFGVPSPGTELLNPLDFTTMRVIKVSSVVFMRQLLESPKDGASYQ